MPHLDEFADFGKDLIGRTRELVLDLWNRSTLSSELKEDQTPVSEVDLRCEELVRSRLRAVYPGHGVVGEEFGAERADAEFVWTIDPIDGTQNLVNRIPTFGTILALLHRGEPVLGFIDHPVLGEFLWGGPEIGVFRGGTRVVLDDLVSAELTPNDLVGTNCASTFKGEEQLSTYVDILRFHPHSRIYYDVFAHTLAVTGSLAVMVEYNLKIWDLAATKALMKGAGGAYREIGMTPPSGKTPKLFHAAFGKPRAVELISKILPHGGGTEPMRP